MSTSEAAHVVDRRVDLLAEAITAKVEVLAAFYNPAGGHIPLVDQLSSDDAFTLWSKHRYDDSGKLAVSKMAPADVAKLDAWLAAEQNRRGQPEPHEPRYNPTEGQLTRQEASAQVSGLGAGSPY